MRDWKGILRRVANGMWMLYLCNGTWLVGKPPIRSGWASVILLIAVILSISVGIDFKKYPTKRIRTLARGCEDLRAFLTAVTVLTLWTLALLLTPLDWGFLTKGTLIWLAVVAAALAVVFWIGMIQVYLTSVQLGIKHRVLAALCGWIPFLNIWYLTKIIRIAAAEVEFETEKWELDATRVENELCKTRYPVLLVHGVFFRDFRYLNYWGRIPQALKRNGATVYYGQQQSAASVEDSGRELAARIREIIRESGCEKVNIIAHSKGGLDSRAAISQEGCGPYVATLTTINTPHRGCIFAEYLLGKVPQAARQKMASVYNATLKRLGDTNPDFLAAVNDLTASACLARNETTPDAPEVVYESVMSLCKMAQNGKFPLNVTYPVVKHFDGQNDGLVSVESARWGSAFTLLKPKGKRGISHGDVVDLNRENILGFDVREFYVELVGGLKKRGY